MMNYSFSDPASAPARHAGYFVRAFGLSTGLALLAWGVLLMLTYTGALPYNLNGWGFVVSIPALACFLTALMILTDGNGVTAAAVKLVVWGLLPLAIASII